jgi:predicted O-methyltransferase YrrM
MKPILVGRKQISPVIWDVILQSTCALAEHRRSRFYEETQALEALQAYADYKTGSITAATCWSLLSVAHYFKPQIIFEVGTFIGKSTLSLLRGMQLSGVIGGRIYTCDFSNDIDLPFCGLGEVIQFRRQSSTQMFSSLCADELKCDFLALDGRLQKDDLHYLSKILHANSIILLDDFEGVEKGVSNAALLMNSLQPSHILVYPPEKDVLRKFSLLDGCTTALILPKDAFTLSNQ